MVNHLISDLYNFKIFMYKVYKVCSFVWDSPLRSFTLFIICRLIFIERYLWLCVCLCKYIHHILECKAKKINNCPCYSGGKGKKKNCVWFLGECLEFLTQICGKHRITAVFNCALEDLETLL